MLIIHHFFRFIFFLTASCCVASYYTASPETTGTLLFDSSAVYAGWLQNTTYSNSIFIPSPNTQENGAAIHWSIIGDEIQIAVAVKATGWVAFGISENGGMRGADVVLFTAENNQLEDAYLLNELERPIPDDCQNWRLVNSIKKDGMIIFEARRALDTGDSQDRALNVDDSSRLVPPNRVIAAWGDTTRPSYHGPNNRVKGSIRFFKSKASDEHALFRKAMDADAEGSFIIQSKNHTVAAVDTVYTRVCVGSKELEAQGVPMNMSLHTIGFEPIIDKTKYVHHYMFLASHKDFDSSISSCNDFVPQELAYAWAPGENPLALPTNVGGLLGKDGYMSFQLEIHYNNPWLDEGNIDNSGVRVYFTSEKREHELGILQTGDPLFILHGEEVGEGLSRHTFLCPSTCSSFSVKQNLTVFRELFHMHKRGIRMYNSQIRSGEVIRQAKADFYDFDQQGSLAIVQEPYQLLPGDSFETSCYYNSKKSDKWGISSEDEMCITFLVYYPRQIIFNLYPFICPYGLREFGTCSSSYERTLLSNQSQVERSFGTVQKGAKCVRPANVTSILQSPAPPPTTQNLAPPPPNMMTPQGPTSQAVSPPTSLPVAQPSSSSTAVPLVAMPYGLLLCSFLLHCLGA